jgi:spectinomycin phosphotransferase
VDWESLKLAPPERDLQVLLDTGEATVDADRRMVELFDLDWRLDEIDQYSTWFATEHADSADDRIAFGDLLHELHRA